MDKKRCGVFELQPSSEGTWDHTAIMPLGDLLYRINNYCFQFGCQKLNYISHVIVSEFTEKTL